MYNLIIKNLYIGDYIDAVEFNDMWKNSVIICVLENKPSHEPERALHIPVLKPTGLYSSATIQADKKQLDKVADVIHKSLTENKMTLTHCAAGMERSPLSVVWYLMKYKNMDLDTAYKTVKSRRKQTIDRREWLKDEE